MRKFVDELVSLADALDRKGLVQEANLIDLLIQEANTQTMTMAEVVTKEAGHFLEAVKANNAREAQKKASIIKNLLVDIITKMSKGDNEAPREEKPSVLPRGQKPSGLAERLK